MSGSYRLVIAAALGLAALVVLGTGAYFGALYGTHYSHKAEIAANRDASAKRDYPSQIDRDRTGLPDFAERVASGPDPQSADEREKRDLAAQESMSVWAFWMLVASSVGVVTTMIGTCFLLWQISLTREALEDTGKATVAMVRQNELTEKVQRPWLDFDVSVSEPRFSGQYFSFSLKIEIHNIGKTPAIDVGFFHSKHQLFSVNGDKENDTLFAKIPRVTGNTCILPNGKHIIKLSLSLNEKDWIIPDFGPSLETESSISPYHCVVVYYRWDGEEVFHRTGYWFLMHCVLADLDNCSLPVKLIKDNRLHEFGFHARRSGSSIAT
ncbi:MAG: hypothetical protein CVT77_10505 [Alphaproteobacteria bacterium HGW-Alphaproteobacteria-16]|nr:MAG: hypothetical protein CVT77_10505 [Alphaproteobacteria bacterium HGW-Alphaproteobacteria-16]